MATRIVVPFQRLNNLGNESVQRLQDNIGNALDPIIALLAKPKNVSVLEGDAQAPADHLHLGTDITSLPPSAAPLIHVHSGADITSGIGVSKAVQSGAGGVLEASAVTTAELAHVSGVTSAIQTQLAARELTANKGANNGYAPLDGSGDVPDANLPAGIQRTSEKDAPDGYAGLDGNSDLTPSQIPTIGWHLNKDGADQLNLGTALELVTWVDSHADAFVSGVTFTDASDKITIVTAGKYLILITIRWVNATVADGNTIDAHIAVAGSSVASELHTAGGGVNSNTRSIILDLAVDDEITVLARDQSITTADVEGTATTSGFSGFRIG